MARVSTVAAVVIVVMTGVIAMKAAVAVAVAVVFVFVVVCFDTFFFFFFFLLCCFMSYYIVAVFVFLVVLTSRVLWQCNGGRSDTGKCSRSSSDVWFCSSCSSCHISSSNNSCRFDYNLLI